MAGARTKSRAVEKPDAGTEGATAAGPLVRAFRVPGSDRLAPGEAVVFTSWWPEVGRWEGGDLRIEVVAPTDRPDSVGSVRSARAGSR
jgi:hypothetical protein